MLSGFNTNIRHRGVLFHVQSEDSGRDRPHIITHLYYGGTIVSSEKSSYAEFLDEPDLTSRVRELMEAQHKSVVEALRSRKFDDLIRERLGESVFDVHLDSKSTTKPTAVAAPEAHPSAEVSEPDEPSGRPFGEGIVTEKPLDEVILSYLVENARKRKRERS